MRQVFRTRPPLHGSNRVGSTALHKVFPWLSEPTFRLPAIYTRWTVPLRKQPFQPLMAIADPPQLPTEDSDPLRTQNVDDQGNLCASPSTFAVIGEKCIMFEARWEHQCSLRM